MSEKTIDHFCSDTYYKLFSCFKGYDRKLIHLLKSLLDFEPSHILDLACGVGLSTLALRTSFPRSKILGIDIDSELLGLAEKELSCNEVEFQCGDIASSLETLSDNSIDLIFVKSAYHYFDDQITISHLKPLLKPNGVIVVAERTARSAKSYPLPHIASSYWEDIFSHPRPTHRFDAADKSDTELFVSCFGEHINIPADIYFDAVRKNQLVGLWLLKPEIVEEWIDEQLSKKTDSFTVFEEFWLYFYQNKAK